MTYNPRTQNSHSLLDPSNWRQLLHDNILPMEREDKATNRAKDGNYNPNFEAMLSAVFLAIGIGNRTATLPAWESIDHRRYKKFLGRLNQVVPESQPKLVIVQFQHKELSGNIKPKYIVTYADNHTLHRQPQLTDIDLGILFGFYRPNVYNYSKDLRSEGYAFQILVSSSDAESPSHTLLFAETFFPDYLSDSEKQEFRKHCGERIARYNEIMEALDWPYRVYGDVEVIRQLGSTNPDIGIDKAAVPCDPVDSLWCVLMVVASSMQYCQY